jgi:hypothetical protein
MKITTLVRWSTALLAARTTISKKDINKQPSKKWKLQMLYAEHSPIRSVRYFIEITNLKRWISTHLVRHFLGINHFVGTQRTDRTGIDRSKLTQDEESVHAIDMNAQAFINVSRKRLCKQSSEETTKVWRTVISTLKQKDPELASVCVPECVYRGFCPELQPCGYSESTNYTNNRVNYVNTCKQLQPK